MSELRINFCFRVRGKCAIVNPPPRDKGRSSSILVVVRMIRSALEASGVDVLKLVGRLLIAVYFANAALTQYHRPELLAPLINKISGYFGIHGR